jgi:crossover junction endonuclease MUS81
MIKLLIDNREHSVIKEFEDFDFKDCNVEYCQLNVGDFQYWIDDKLVLVIERKTYEDLASSIKDGRYKEQKFRLQELCENTGCSVIYFIEKGKRYGKVISGMPISTLDSAILSLVSKENIDVLNLKDSHETSVALRCFLLMDKTNVIEGSEYTNFCSLLHNKMLQKGSSKNYNKATVESTTKKKTHMTMENVFIQQLCLVKSVSLKIAERIVQDYNSFYSLVKKYESLSSEKERECLLKNLVYGDKKRKIGPVASKNIYYFCYGKIIENKNDNLKDCSSIAKDCDPELLESVCLI